MTSITKAQSLTHWEGLEPGQNPLPHMRPITYKARGSRYGACGVRIDGSPEFIDAVLSNLKPLLKGEAVSTRLELARHTVEPAFDKKFENADTGAEVCYIRLHTRGHEGAIMAGFLKDLKSSAARHIHEDA